MTDSSIINDLRVIRRQLSSTDLVGPERSSERISSVSSVVHAARPEFGNLVNRIDSLLSFLQYLSSLPADTLSSLAKLETGLQSLEPQPTTFLGAGASFYVSTAKVKPHYIDDSNRINKWKFIAVKAPRVHQNEGRVQTQSIQPRALREIAWELRVLCHKPLRTESNIAGYFGFTWKPWNTDPNLDTQFYPCICMEFTDLGTLDDLFNPEYYQLTYSIKWALAKDIGKGMSVLHKNRIVHGDLKAQNVLIFPDHGTGLIAKVADFAFSLDNFDDGDNDTIRGLTPLWNAPELDRKQIDPTILRRADIYSYGLLVWRLMLEGRTPLDHPEYAKGCAMFEELIGKDLHESLPIIARMKSDGDKFLLRVEATIAGRGLQQLPLQSLLRATIRLDPKKRAESFDVLLDLPAKENMKLFPPGNMAPEISFPDGSYIGQSYRTDRSVLNLYRMMETLPSRVLHQAFNEVLQKSLIRSEALLDLALCHFLAIGTLYNPQKGLEILLDSAAKGDIKAKAIAWRIHSAILPGMESNHPWDSWLFDAACLGSTIAAEDLKIRNTSLYKDASDRISLLWQYGSHLKSMNEAAMTDFVARYRTQRQIEEWIFENPELDLGYLRCSGFTLLHLAAISNDISMVNFLLEKGAEINVLTFKDETPVLCACRCGNVQVLRVLLERGGSATQPTLAGQTPLHYLISFSPENVSIAASLLVLGGANLNAACLPYPIRHMTVQFLCEDLTYGGTPLHWAISAGREDIVKHLMKIGADLRLDDGLADYPLSLKLLNEFQRGTPLRVAISHCHKPSIQILKDASSSTSQPEQVLLEREVHYLLNISEFEHMCKNGAKFTTEVMEMVYLLYPEIPAHKLLRLAIMTRSFFLVRHLVSQGIDINESSPGDSLMQMYPLQVAATTLNNEAMVLYMLDLKADPQNHYPEGATCLTTVVMGSLGPFAGTIVSRMAQLGCSYKKSPETFKYLLLKSLRKADFRLAELVLSITGDTDNILRGMLSELIPENNRETLPAIQWLIGHQKLRASVFVLVDNETPFHLLAKIREPGRDENLNWKLTELLLAGCNNNKEYLDRKNSRGRTALHLAIEHGNYNLFQSLLAAGADIEAEMFSVPMCLMQRIESHTEAPIAQETLYETARRCKILRKLVQDTAQLIVVWAQHCNRISHEAVVCAPSTERVMIVLRKWLQPGEYEKRAQASLQEMLPLGAEIDATAGRVRLPGSLESRRLTLQELQQFSEMLFPQFLHECKDCED
ncbi:hypothetical protein F4679DRAFT_537791 [Xylaria curta]|nr:hypothetical protein F4679DRAFT_537791 [Xylaria curta]